jgi:hypothetical protein
MSGRVLHLRRDGAEQMTYAPTSSRRAAISSPAAPRPRQFVEAYLKDVTMHEVGHTLGLRHNFRAVARLHAAAARRPGVHARNGITGSVMEYAPINLNSADEPRERYGTPFNDTLGPYDYWAIEYAYKPLASGLSAADERAALEKIAGPQRRAAARLRQRRDNFIGVDPETLQFDLGGDVIAFARKRIAIAQELLKRQETRTLRPTRTTTSLKRSVTYALRDVARAANVLSRQIGGVRTVRDAPGTGRDPLTPVPVAEQREALDLITGSLLSADSFSVSPALQRKLGADFAERTDAIFGGEGSTLTDYSPSGQVLGLQRSLLAVMMSDTVATRLLESSEKAPSGSGRALRMPELYGG